MPALRKSREAPGLWLLLFIVAVAWGIELADRILPVHLEGWGIQPRRLRGLPGVILSPWLHGAWDHLIANTVTFLGLGIVMLVAEGKRFVETSWLLVLASGLGTWLIGRGGATHIGASGLIYGYFGYILGRAIWERRLGWALAGIGVGLLYGGMIWGVLPTRAYVSWEAHLAGLLGGMWLGKAHADSGARSRPRRRARTAV